jgi:hypothetical protein
MVVDREFRSDLVRHLVNGTIGHCSQLCSPA